MAWSAAMRKLLSDGEWHERAELLEVGKAAVPPGVAYRRAEAHRIAGGRPGDVGPEERQHGDHERAVAVGKNRIANDLLRGWVKRQMIERDGDRYRALNMPVKGRKGSKQGFANRKPWTDAMRRLLDDGEWHERAELLEAGKAAATPEAAFNRGNQRRKNLAVSSEHVVAVGAHRLASDSLRNWVGRRVVERDGDRYRARAGWHVIVDDDG